jgi:hypothetical protein
MLPLVTQGERQPASLGGEKLGLELIIDRALRA